MRQGLLGFATGVVVLHQLPGLPHEAWFAAAGAAGVVLAVAGGGRGAAALAAGLLVGLSYAGWFANMALEHRLPAPLEGRTLRVEGRIVGLPRQEGYRSVFLFVPEGFPDKTLAHPPRTLRLSWYGGPDGLAAGQRWAFDVRLKRPRGLLNPGAFDYERWLFAQRIDAVGYVRGAAAMGSAGTTVDRVRQRLAQRLSDLAGEGEGGRVIPALAVADRRGISTSMWRVFNATGTGHLLAISGLHIGLAAALGALAVSFIWRRWSVLCRLLPPRLAGALAGMGLAGAYALLAGLGLPTQRALLMTGVAALALVSRRHWRAADVFLWALAMVLFADPMAPLGAGFWLSFWAVAVLMLAAAGARRGRRWLSAQLTVSCGLFPLLGLWFGELPWISPLANLVAVPVISLLVVPLVFVGLASLWLSGWAAGWVLWVAASILDLLLQGLTWAAGQAATWVLPEVPLWLSAAAALGMIWLLVPGRWPGRPLALTLLLPALLYRPAPLGDGTVRVTFADAGQGTAVVVETRRHVLVYDTGPRLGRTDAASAALLPLLRGAGHDRVDRLVVTHADADHAGGLKSLLAADLKIGTIMAGEPLDAVAARSCRRGQAWRWDGVAFRMLYPEVAEAGNDASCVLHISTPAGLGVLLAGDISAATEQRLVSLEGADLRSDLLLVPHHGSDSSSSPAFVKAVAPREAVFTVGYRNRYGLPDDSVVARYLMAGAAVRETARTGALSYRLDTRLRLLGRYRRDARRYLHAP